ADVFLEKKFQRTISDMVENDGWAFFRAREKEALKELNSIGYIQGK
ncbi:MAG: shikimate kinase II, partial [bacterium]|nr:shikimate kinase II [bacterium]